MKISINLKSSCSEARNASLAQIYIPCEEQTSTSENNSEGDDICRPENRGNADNVLKEDEVLSIEKNDCVLLESDRNTLAHDIEVLRAQCSHIDHSLSLLNHQMKELADKLDTLLKNIRETLSNKECKCNRVAMANKEDKGKWTEKNHIQEGAPIIPNRQCKTKVHTRRRASVDTSYLENNSSKEPVPCLSYLKNDRGNVFLKTEQRKMEDGFSDCQNEEYDKSLDLKKDDHNVLQIASNAIQDNNLPGTNGFYRNEPFQTMKKPANLQEERLSVSSSLEPACKCQANEKKKHQCIEITSNRNIDNERDIEILVYLEHGAHHKMQVGNDNRILFANESYLNDKVDLHLFPMKRLAKIKLTDRRLCVERAILQIDKDFTTVKLVCLRSAYKDCNHHKLCCNKMMSGNAYLLTSSRVVLAVGEMICIQYGTESCSYSSSTEYFESEKDNPDAIFADGDSVERLVTPKDDSDYLMTKVRLSQTPLCDRKPYGVECLKLENSDQNKVKENIALANIDSFNASDIECDVNPVFNDSQETISYGEMVMNNMIESDLNELCRGELNESNHEWLDVSRRDKSFPNYEYCRGELNGSFEDEHDTLGHCFGSTRACSDHRMSQTVSMTKSLDTLDNETCTRQTGFVDEKTDMSGQRLNNEPSSAADRIPQIVELDDSLNTINDSNSNDTAEMFGHCQRVDVIDGNPAFPVHSISHSALQNKSLTTLSKCEKESDITFYDEIGMQLNTNCAIPSCYTKSQKASQQSLVTRCEESYRSLTNRNLNSGNLPHIVLVAIERNAVMAKYIWRIASKSLPHYDIHFVKTYVENMVINMLKAENMENEEIHSIVCKLV